MGEGGARGWGAAWAGIANLHSVRTAAKWPACCFLCAFSLQFLKWHTCEWLICNLGFITSVCYGWIFRFDRPRACAILGIDVSVWKLCKCQKIPSLTLGVWLGRDPNVMGSKKNEYKEHFRHNFMSPIHPHFHWFAGLSRNKQVKAFWIW